MPEKIERVLLEGDLSALGPEERLSYYRAVCTSLRLNPLTRPLEYVKLNNRLVLYARRDCTDQLRALYNVKVQIIKEEDRDGLRIVYARASLPNGRMDEDLGAVATKGLAGLDLANAMMKAATKAKRRATLSICGLGLLDETELEGIHPAAPLTPPEDVMPRRRDEPPAPIPASEPKPGGGGGPMRSDTQPGPARAELKAERPEAAAAPPASLAPGALEIEINGRKVVTGGITKETLLKCYRFGAQLDELEQKGAAKDLLGREFGLEHRQELTEPSGQRYLAELTKRVNRALASRGAKS